MYPLVNVCISMERSAISNGENSRTFDWAMFQSYVTNYQRLYPLIYQYLLYQLSSLFNHIQPYWNILNHIKLPESTHSLVNDRWWRFASSHRDSCSGEDWPPRPQDIRFGPIHETMHRWLRDSVNSHVFLFTSGRQTWQWKIRKQLSNFELISHSLYFNVWNIVPFSARFNCHGFPEGTVWIRLVI